MALFQHTKTYSTQKMISKFLEHKHFGFFSYQIWWWFWLVLHNTSLSTVTTADLYYQSHFILMNLFVALGYISINIIPSKPPKNIIPGKEKVSLPASLYRFYSIAFLCFVAITITAHLSGALSMSFNEYFFKVRGAHQDAVGSLISGINILDFGLKLFVYPLIVALIICSASITSNAKKYSVVLSFILALFFAYIYQVNYPIVFFFFALILNPKLTQEKNKVMPNRKNKLIKPLAIIAIIFILLMSAANRYGEFDLKGIITYYFVNYHTLGFYMYQAKIEGLYSAGLDFTFGRSFLGPIELYVAKFLEILGCVDCIKPTFLENGNYSAIFIPAHIDGRVSNAFTTSAFTFYRDFGVIGVALGGFAYGIALSFLRAKKSQSLACLRIYHYLLVVGFLSIMVSPFEQPYIWMAPLAIIFMSKTRRPRKLSATPDLSGKVPPPCHMKNSA